MRGAVKRLGGDPRQDQPAGAGRPGDRPLGAGRRLRLAATRCSRTPSIEFERNRERYEFLRWGQKAFDNFRVVPPATGIVHQVNLEYLAKGVLLTQRGRRARSRSPTRWSAPTRHTTMINGLGVLGWGVGGIEAEAAMLGQPLYMVTPQVVGFKLTGKLREGVTATDLVLTVTQMLRKKGVVEKFVEFFGPGLGADDAGRPRHHRQHGARVRRDLRLLPGRRRDAALPAPHRPHRGRGRPRRALPQGAGPVPHASDARSRSSPTRSSWTWRRSSRSLAGPKRPQDRVRAVADEDRVPPGARPRR